MDALSRIDVGAVQYLTGATAAEQTEGFLGSSEEDSWSDDSEDSFADMTEAERLEFLSERDRFLNAECARIAQLPDEENRSH